MKLTLRLNAAIGTFLLHAGAVVALVAALSGGHEPPAPLPPLKVELVKPALPVPMPVAQVQPEQPPLPPPQPKKQREPKPHTKAEAKLANPQRKTPTPKPAVSEAATDSRPAPVAAAAPAPPTSTALAPAAPAPPPAPVKTAPTDAAYASSNRKPRYPRVSQANGDEGTTVLHVLVKADGSAGEVQVKQSSGFPLLDESARSTVQSWRFTPATVDGKPVAEWYQVDVPFKLLNN